MLRLMLKLCWD